MKIDHYIASQSSISRRKILEFIKKNAVTLNAKIVTSLTVEMDPDKDIVKVDGVPILNKKQLEYYKFYKPLGVISTLNDPRDRPSLQAFIKRDQSLTPIGRLDRKTKGLMLFTNDGQFANQVSHPKFELSKTYQVTLDKKIKYFDMNRLSTGIFLNDGPIQFEKIELINKNIVIIVIKEGRNRIVRRSFSFLGYTVEKLKRIAIGPIRLDDLNEGQMKRLTKTEFKAIKAQLSKSSKGKEKTDQKANL